MTPERSRGFTLVEVVVALTILSLIVLATLTAMRTLGQTQSRLDDRVSELNRLRAVSSFLRRSIGQARPLTLFMSGQPQGQHFFGTESELDWVAPLTAPGLEGGLAALGLRSNDAGQLVLWIRDSATYQAWSENDTSYVLVDGLEEIQIGYRANRYADWKSEWPLAQDVPAPSHVRLVLKVAGRYWPEFIIAVGR